MILSTSWISRAGTDFERRVELGSISATFFVLFICYAFNNRFFVIESDELQAAFLALLPCREGGKFRILR